jgi:hypothetical protein
VVLGASASAAAFTAGCPCAGAALDLAAIGGWVAGAAGAACFGAAFGCARSGSFKLLSLFLTPVPSLFGCWVLVARPGRLPPRLSPDQSDMSKA